MARTRKALPAKVAVAHLISEDRVRQNGRTVRVIDYTLEGSAGDTEDRYRLIANLLDREQAGAEERAALYHERREIEGVLDEFEMHLCASSTALRSKTPELVQQEPRGLRLAHFAIRQLIAQAAWPRQPDPDRLSFAHAVRVIERKLPQAAAVPPERLPARREALLAAALCEQPWSNQPARRQTQDEQPPLAASGGSAPSAATATARSDDLNGIGARRTALRARRASPGPPACATAPCRPRAP